MNKTLIYSFQYKPEMKIDGSMIGPIAEQSPSVIANDKRTQVNMYNMIGLMYAAVQSLTDRIEKLEGLSHAKQ